MVKKLKDVVKTNPEPARGTVGVNPSNPWSAKANIAESGGLDAYLSSRGIDPKRVSKETKISHAKSSAFLKWKQDHTFESVEYVQEDALLDKFLLARGVNPKTIPTNIKVSYAKSAAFLKWKKDHLSESMTTQHTPTERALHRIKKAIHMHKEIPSDGLRKEEVDKKDTVTLDIPLLIRVLELAREDIKTDMDLHRVVERLIKIRTKGMLTMDDYDTIANINENHIAIAMGKMLDDEGSMVLTQLEQLERAIGMIRSYIGKDYEKQLPAWVQAKITLATDYADTVGNYIVSKNEKVTEEVKKTKPTALEKFRRAAAEREKKHSQTPTGDLKGAIDRLEKHLNKEEVEQIDELKKSTVFSWLKKQPVVATKKPGMDRKAHNQRIKTHTKSWNRALDRLSGYKPTSENTLDPQAATEAPCDCANNPNDTSEKKRQMTKSARMIKSLYKKHNMKEETYDWEKDDKSQQPSYGKKKPKISKEDDSASYGNNKPEARAIMSGGTTLTGEKRDTVEIDPLMRNRPDLNGNYKYDTDKKKNKINNQ
jgi:hypothetical protein